MRGFIRLGLIRRSWRLARGITAGRTFARAIHLHAWLLALSLLAASLLAACASGPKLVDHSFSFDGWFDRWVDQVDLLEYSYGDQYVMVRNSLTNPRSEVYRGRKALPASTGVSGAMPIGDFLHVKWRVKATGEVIEDRVDLKGRLPANMTNHGLTFVIDQRQLYVYLVTPQPKSIDAPPLLRTYLSKYTVTYEIYPTNTYKQK